MQAVTRQTIIRFALAGLLLFVAALFWWLRPTQAITPERARAIATMLFDRYAQETGEPGRHFEGPRTISYADGWEYHWVYMPCADIGELRIFISRRGAASYTATPDCNPLRGFNVLPQRI